MILKVKFAESIASFETRFGEVHNISDGGYERGYEAGYNQGYKDGFTEGEAKGNADGYKQGYDVGLADGENQGYTKGYEAGYQAGYAKGKQDGYANGYTEGYTEGYTKAESVNPFYYATKLDNVYGGQVFPENYECVIRLQKAPTICTYIFNNAYNLKSVKFISEDQTNVVNFGASCNIADHTKATLEVVDFAEFNKKFSSLTMSFRNQAKLKSILGVLDLSNCTEAHNTFVECKALEDIEFVPNTINISIVFNSCTKLTKASITSIINGLSADTSELTVTLSKTAVNNAFGSAESAEWLALVATKPNWTISLS